MRQKYATVFLTALSVFAAACGRPDNAPTTAANGAIVQASAPGEATLDLSGQKVKTTIKKVSVRKQAFPEDPYSEAAAGKVYLTFQTEVENVGDEPNTLGGGYSLRLPSGDTMPYEGIADGDKALLFGEPIPPGETRTGNLTWEVPVPGSGAEYVLLWKPNPMSPEQARFVYKHRRR